MNGYKITDLGNDPTLLGRHYKKCLGSQIQPCVGADGHIYVCPNQRGYKQYSYGCLTERSFKDIWQDIGVRQKVMHQIDDVEKFSKCTALCKPNESNKMFYYLHEEYNKFNSAADKETFKEILLNAKEDLSPNLMHKEFI